MTEETEILKKIKKLLALSKDKSNVHEAELAAQKVQELLLAYNLNLSQAEAIEDKPKEPIGSHYGSKTANRNLIRWKVDLAVVLAQYNLCKIYLSGNRIVWVGKKSNTEVAQFLYDTLVYDLQKICDSQWDTILKLRELQEEYTNVTLLKGDLQYVNGKTWKNSFFQGAVTGIRQKLAEQYQLLKTNPNMNALIVVNDKDLQQYYDGLHLRAGRGSGPTNFSGSGYSSGKETGRNMSFKKGVGYGGGIGPKQLNGGT